MSLNMRASASREDEALASSPNRLQIDAPKNKLLSPYLAKTPKNRFWILLVLIALISFGFGLLIDLNYYKREKEIIEPIIEKPVEIIKTEEEAIIRVVEQISPAVVSIVATRDLPRFISPFEFFDYETPKKEFERREVGWGSGFIVSADGLILTNRHVVDDEKANYSVIFNDGREFPAKILAQDRVRDLAILQIETEEVLPKIKLGNSNNLQVGQTAIAIGNMLGEFQNSVSKGIVSGLGRRVTAKGGGMITKMEDVIQTDAAINPGNSGGPLLNLKGKVIGINTAMALGAENIGFAIPINQAKEALQEVKEYGRIIHPFLGVRHIPITKRIQREYNLPVSYGSLVFSGKRNQPAIFPSSAAEKAGIEENDIILKINQEKITSQNPLAKIIIKYNPGDEVSLTLIRNGREKTIEVILGEMK